VSLYSQLLRTLPILLALVAHPALAESHEREGRRGSLGDGGGGSSSQASNFGHGAEVSVNARTGGVSIKSEIFQLAGVHKDLPAHLVLTFQS